MLKQIVFSSALMLSGAALAQTPAPPPTMASPATTAAPAMAPAPPTAMAGGMASTSKSKLSAADKKFIDKVASANSAEIQIMQAAQQKADDQKIKDMAQTMLADHQDAGQKMTALAQQKGVEVPTDLAAADQKEVDKLTKLDGKKFDKAFTKDETKDHKQLLVVLKKEASSGKDPDVKAFAEAVIPTVQKHIDMLENKGG